MQEISLEPEIQAMGKVYGALKDLEDDQMRQRVLHWVASKFSLAPAPFSLARNGLAKTPAAAMENKGGAEQGGLAEYASMSAVFERATAKTEPERVLLAAAFLQEKHGKQELTGFEINAELKNLGLMAGNITDSIGSLMSRKPQLMIQTKKEGNTRQAKKKYRVTTEGIKVAKRLAAGGSDTE